MYSRNSFRHGNMKLKVSGTDWLAGDEKVFYFKNIFPSSLKSKSYSINFSTKKKNKLSVICCFPAKTINGGFSAWLQLQQFTGSRTKRVWKAIDCSVRKWCVRGNQPTRAARGLIVFEVIHYLFSLLSRYKSFSYFGWIWTFSLLLFFAFPPISNTQQTKPNHKWNKLSFTVQKSNFLLFKRPTIPIPLERNHQYLSS